MHLCSANRLLEFIAMDIVGPFPKNVQGYKYILVTMDSCSKLTRATPTSKTTVTHVADAFMDHLLIPVGLPTCFLTDDGTQFVNKLFATVFALLAARHLLPTAYHPQTNGQVQQFNKIFRTGFLYYVAKNQNN